MKRLLALLPIALIACTPEPDYKAEFPAVPDALADRIIEMECSELVLVDVAMGIIMNSSGTFVQLLALSQDVRQFVGPVLDASDRVQEQTRGLARRMGEVRECAF